jgi:hypothetical protein
MAVNQDHTVTAAQNSRIRRLLLLFKNSSKSLILSATRTMTKTDGSELLSSNKTAPGSSCRNLSFSHPNGFSASEMENQRYYHRPRHSIDSIASPDSIQSDLLPVSPLDVPSSPAQPPKPPGSPLSVRKSPQSHTITPPYDVEKGHDAPKMPEIFIPGLHPGNVTIAPEIDRSGQFHLAKHSEDTSQKFSTRNLHGTLQIHSCELTEGPIVKVSRSRGGLESSEGPSGHKGKQVIITPMVCV